MSTTAVVLLGLIAGATVVMAAIQVGLVIVAVRLARKMEQLSTRLEQDVRPLIATATAVSENAARVTGLAVDQMERADRLIADVSGRIEDTTALLQRTLLAPVREGRALRTAIGVAIRAFRDAQHQGRPRLEPLEDDDPLFIG